VKQIPQMIIDLSTTIFTQRVLTSPISDADNFTGFQADFTFDEIVVTFQNPPESPQNLQCTTHNN
jgi:hypothetical protein